MFYFFCVFVFMYYLHVKNYKPITVQYYIADCVSWIPRLTLLGIRANWTYKYTLGMELVCIEDCTPHRKRYMSTSQTGRCCLLYYPTGRRKLWRQPSQSDCSCPTNEKSPYFGLLASSSELFHDYTASQAPSFPFKNKLLSFLFSGFACGLP